MVSNLSIPNGSGSRAPKDRLTGNPRWEVPQGLADRLCWEEFVAEVARVYEALPEEDRKGSVIFGGTYHSAGAIDFLGKKYGLPSARSTHNNYYLWGPGDTSYDVVIVVDVGVSKASLENMFAEVVEAGRTSCEYTDRLGRNSPVYVCREPKRPIADVWAGGKEFK